MLHTKNGHLTTHIVPYCPGKNNWGIYVYIYMYVYSEM